MDLSEGQLTQHIVTLALHKKKLIKNSKKCNKSLRFLFYVIVMVVQAYMVATFPISAYLQQTLIVKS